jgi:Sec-independent protein translocase protein TatA
MSGLEGDPPRLAEIMRQIQDFRSEFREAMGAMVRRDVYEANMQTVKLRQDNTDADVQQLSREVSEDRKDRKATKNLAIGIAVPGILSFLAFIADLLVK